MGRHRHHLAPLVERVARGDQAARAARRLDHHHGPGEARDQPVPAREVPRGGREAERLFRNQQPLGPDALRKRKVLGRVGAVEPARQHGDRAGRQGGLVGGGVDPARQARDHHQPGLAEPCAQPPRRPQPQRRGIARADQRDGRFPRQVGLAQQPQQGRRVGDAAQGGGIAARPERHQPRPESHAGLVLLRDTVGRAGRVVVHAGLGRELRQRLQRRGSAAMREQQSSEGGRADAARPDQAEPVERLGLGNGRGQVSHARSSGGMDQAGGPEPRCLRWCEGGWGSTRKPVVVPPA